MSGEIADIPTLIELKRSHSATLMIDDAHGIGVLGENGRGCGEHFSVNPKDIDILICPLGKAFGNFGAIVAGSHSLIEALIQFSRTYIYTTAPPPLLAESARTALKIIKNEYWRREKLIELTEHFQHLAEQHAFIIPNSKTPIQSIIIGENTKTKTISKKLQEKGILAHAILPPTVAEDSARLRVTLTAHHSKQDIDKFFQTLAACCE